jgi:Secretion system C-terminal sorting domain/Beta-propeller repeat
MKKTYTLLFALCLGIITSNAQTFQWAKRIGGTSSEAGNSIVVDDSGNVYTTGVFDGTNDFDPGAGTSYLTSAGFNDIFISKLDAVGNFLWAKSIGGTNYDLGSSIALDGSGNVYTTGYFEGTADFDPGVGISNLTSVGSYDIFISKLDASGNFLWAKNMGGTSFDFGNSIVLDGSGNVYITGYFLGIANFNLGTGTNILTSSGGMDIFISKLDTAGNFLWVKSMGGTSGDRSNSIALDGSGNVYTTGSFQGTADFDPGAGTSNLTSTGSNPDIFISKLDTAGNFLWAKSIGGTQIDEGISIVVDGSGNVYTTGLFRGAVDFDPGVGTNNLTSAGDRDIFVSKLDAAGNFLWAKSMGGTSIDIGSSIAVDGSGNGYITGLFFGTVDFDPGMGTSNLTSAGGSGDIFISKLDAAGNFLWAKNIGGTSFDGANSITLDGSGNVYLTGAFSGTVDFDLGVGTSNLTGLGNGDIFILKLGVASVGILDNSFGNTLKVYPNPSKGTMSIELGTSYDDVSVSIRNQLGQVVLKKSYSGLNVLQLKLPEAAGLYFLEVSSGSKRAIVKVVKE